MKKNLYYRAVYKRGSIVKEFIIHLFISASSWPRLLLEVFVRKNFGERYFSFSIAVFVALILLVIPRMGAVIGSLIFSGFYSRNSDGMWTSYLTHWLSFDLFTVAFLVLSWRHRQSLKRNPSVFDFARFSLYAGDLDARFESFQPFGKKLSVRQIETLVEPGIFLLAGIVLAILSQNVGWLLIVCSLLWSLSANGQYYLGDEFVMDKIDEMIHNEDLTATLMGHKTLDIDRGVRFYGRRPSNDEMREKLADSFFEDTTVEAVDMA